MLCQATKILFLFIKDSFTEPCKLGHEPQGMNFIPTHHSLLAMIYRRLMVIRSSQ